MLSVCTVCILLGWCALQVFAASIENVPWPGSCKSTDVADSVIAGADLSGKVVIITGADGNIAQEVSLALAKVKASLILACRTVSKCEAVQKHINETVGSTNFLLKKHINETANLVGAVEVEQLDLSSRASIAAFVNRVVARHPKIDVLINSAGTYGTFMTHDKLVGLMEINLLGPALVTHLLLPALRGGNGHAPGRVVNVAAATYGTALAANTTVADLAAICTAVDTTLNETGKYYSMSKFLMTHHALELARREPTIAAFALNPGVAVLPSYTPDWLKNLIRHFPHPKLLPGTMQHFIEACNTNEVGWDSCPQTLAQGAGVIVAAAAWRGVESYSGSYLDFDTAPLPPDAPQVYGPFKQKEPTCQPRPPPAMDSTLRSEWYDEMLRLMGVRFNDAHMPKASAMTVQELIV
jgi:NAD(P)-dependent dehydrogenase (short-subunit alcohol dehydrogenase family)